MSGHKTTVVSAASKEREPRVCLDLLPNELRIEVLPRGYDQWIGNSGALIAEGLVPPQLVWPKGRQPRHWTDGGFDFWLERIRPDGHQGPYSSWLNGDHWRLRRTPVGQPQDGLAAARVHALRVQLEREIWRSTTEAEDLYRLAWHAQRDRHFQRFLGSIPGMEPPAKRTRKSRESS